MAMPAQRGVEVEPTGLPDERGMSTVSSAGEASEVPVRVRQLRVVFGGEAIAIRSIPLDRARIVLGREPGDDEGVFVIAATEVSRRHAILEHDPAIDSWRVSDGGSRNGTFVDGAPAEATPLRHGSVIRVGPVLLVCEDTMLAAGRETGRSPLIGRSAAMRRIRADLEVVGPSPIPVLIQGETGVGKELVAAEIHRASRRTGPLVAVNCAAIPGNLAESELFGHTAGAFTGAVTSHAGLFVAANGGSLFLDEIGEMPVELQAKLLRALAMKEIRPVGASQPVRVDVRIIAATNRDLDAEVGAGGFRADLLARLAAWRLALPPLRDRREDILLLAELFLGQAGRRVRLTAHAAEALLLHGWPYNVRELEQLIAVAAVRAAAGAVIRLEHLPAGLAAPLARRGCAVAPALAPLAAIVDRDSAPTRDDLARVLAHHDGNIAEVARFFGKDRRQIYRWLDRHGVMAR